MGFFWPDLNGLAAGLELSYAYYPVLYPYTLYPYLTSVFPWAAGFLLGILFLGLL